MNDRLRLMLGAATVIAGFLIGPMALAAHAQEAAVPTAAVPTLTSVNASSGGGDDVSGGGCAARVSVQIQFDGAVLVTTRSTATGRYRAHVVIPVSAVPGSHRITVVCAGTSGQVTAATTVSVDLPRTGSDSRALAGAAILLTAIGAALSLVRRRMAQ
jgi:LPXTG-motif cell wall-anchored protein